MACPCRHGAGHVGAGGRGGRLIRRVASVEPPPSSAVGRAAKYAVLDHGGVRQWVEEGGTYSAPLTLVKTLVQQGHPGGAGVQASMPHAPSSVFEFTDNVVAVRSNGGFAMGEPFLEGSCVEAELVDSFVGPIPLAAGAAQADAAGEAAALEAATFARYRVLTIRGPAIASSR